MTIKNPSLSAYGYQLLPLVTSQLVGNNREFDFSGIFSSVLLIVGGWELITIEDPSLRPHGYQLLPLATSQLVGEHREFDLSGISGGVLLIVGAGQLVTIEDPLLSTHSYQLLPLAMSLLLGNNRNLMFQAYFEVFNLLLVKGSLQLLKIDYWEPMVTNCCS